MKKMILVTSPPACGKTYISKQLAKNLKHVVYLDKDTLIPLSNRVFAAAHGPVNRSSPFFEENIRDYEYEAIVDIGVEALDKRGEACDHLGGDRPGSLPPENGRAQFRPGYVETGALG